MTPTGEANVLEEFVITEGRKKVPVAGSRCVKGTLKKNALYRVVRGQDTIHEGESIVHTLLQYVSSLVCTFPFSTYIRKGCHSQAEKYATILQIMQFM